MPREGVEPSHLAVRDFESRASASSATSAMPILYHCRMADLEDLQRRLATIEERNARVEADKTWETSIIRTAFLAVITFAVTAFALFVVRNQHAVRDALIAAVGRVVSIVQVPEASAHKESSSSPIRQRCQVPRQILRSRA